MLGVKTVKCLFISVNTTLAKLYQTTEATTKTVVTTLGATGLVKGTMDIAEDLICQDYVCLAVDTIGVCADVLTIGTSFLPGANITSGVTIPISSACKTFRFCCQRSIFKFGCKR